MGRKNGNAQSSDWLENRSILDGLKKFPRYLNWQNASSGLLAGIFGWTCALIIINAANSANLSQTQTISWLFACWGFGAVIGAVIILKYKVPISGAWSIPGAAIVASALQTYTFQELQGAYLVAGIIVLILGVTGAIEKIMKYLPLPIIMAMVAGALLRFGTGMVSSMVSAPVVVGVTILVYLVCTKFKEKIKLPPILFAFVAAVILSLVTKQLDLSKMDSIVFTMPKLSMMKFNLGAIFSVSLPLALLVIGAENAQATGVLMAQGYKPPISFMTTMSGIGGIVTSLFGGHNANIAGPMTAICASEESGPKEGRYVAGLIADVTAGLCGFLACFVVPFIAIVPTAFISTIAALAMMGVICSSLSDAFRDKRLMLGCFFAFVIAAADTPIMGIGAPFWSLLCGTLVSLVFEGKDYRAFIKRNTEE